MLLVVKTNKIPKLNSSNKLEHHLHFFIFFTVVLNMLCLTFSKFFRELSLLHMEALSKFKLAHPQYVFPALYKELFSIDNAQDLIT